MRVLPLLALLIIFIPMIEAVQYGNVTLSASGSGTNVTFTGMSVDADRAEVGDSYITLWNASVTSYGTTVACDVLNFTAPSSSTDSALFPQATGTATNTRTITNALSQSCNATVYVSTPDIVPSSPSVRKPDGSSEYIASVYDSSAGIATFSVGSLPSGTSVLTIDTDSSVVLARTYSSTAASGLAKMIGWLGTIIVLLALAGFVGIAMRGESPIDADEFAKTVFLIVVAGFCIIVGIIILLSVNGL